MSGSFAQISKIAGRHGRVDAIKQNRQQPGENSGDQYAIKPTDYRNKYIRNRSEMAKRSSLAKTVGTKRRDNDKKVAASAVGIINFHLCLLV